jgi:centrosomal protein CEP104
VNISQVQLLSHQSKISTRIELFVGSGGDYFNCTWSRLGYLSLDNNERSNFKARELKSVYLKARGSFLKLLFHKSHINTLNLYNQVGLIALNILGQQSGPRGAIMGAPDRYGAPPGLPGPYGAPAAAAGGFAGAMGGGYPQGR